ncbi:hypothetical protein G6F56_014467 [Rhizopus delemar]|nr:hypothetical protein G6F56_014467 [Rhizopus delemar]
MRAMAAGADGAADALRRRLPAPGRRPARRAGGAQRHPAARLGKPAGAEPGDDHRPGRLQPHAGRQRRAGAERAAAGPADPDR